MIKLIKILSLILILLNIQACNTKKEDRTIGVLSNTMPLKYDKEDGGYLTDTKGILRFGQYHVSFWNKYNGEVKGPIASTWFIERAINGKPDYFKECGEKLRFEEWEKTVEKQKETESWDDWYKPYFEIGTKRSKCIKKVKAKFESEKSYKYFYSKSLQNHKIIYPIRTKRHAAWQFIIYKGRVGDLSLEALTPKQKEDINKLRSHKCYKWGDPQCYDLPGEDSNLYYGVREELYKKEKSTAKISVETEYLHDIRVSSPIKWTEIEGIKINKDMYNYVYQECRKGERYCHFNNYKGNLTPEQKEYIQKVKWTSDK